MSTRKRLHPLKPPTRIRPESCNPAHPRTIGEEQTQRTVSSPARLQLLLNLGWRWLHRQGKLRVLQAKNRRLRVSETVSLGEKRFVSIVEVDGRSFLIGGSATSVALLTQLTAASTSPEVFESVLADVWQGKEAS